MIIDNGSDNREFLITAFSKQPQPVHFTECATARQGINQLALANAAVPHVIFPHLHMPGKDGYQTRTEIKAHDAWAAIPVMITSSSLLRKEEDVILLAVPAFSPSL